MEYLVLPKKEHDALVSAAFAARGFDSAECAAMASICGEAARHGVRTHGFIKALHLDDLFGSRVGGCVPGAVIEKRSPAFAATRVWNANNKLGPAVAQEAMDECLVLAEQFGVGIVSVDRACHYLWGGAYVMRAARAGFIGYTNCTSMLAEVVPHGGNTPTLGTNPHSWAFPTHDAIGFPVVIDWATSAGSMGKVQQLAREGRPLPAGWAVDASGQPTTDPAAASALRPFGGHKGFGLGMLDELFASVIGGWLPTLRGRFAADNVKRSACAFFMAIHPGALSSGDYEGGGDIESNMARVLQDVMGHGNEEAGAIYPGQIEAMWFRMNRMNGGLLLTRSEVDALGAVAGQCGHPFVDPNTLEKVPLAECWWMHQD